MNFAHDVSYNFTTEDTYSITITISNVNGGGETNLDDNELSKDITINSNFIQRKVVLENFTTCECDNCPPIHTLLENYVDTEDNAILVAQHAGYFTDDMTIPENTELLVFYNDGGSTYAPALMIDRYHYDTGLTGGAADPGPVFWPGESTTATTDRIDERLSLPAFIDLNINGEYTSKGSLELDITGEIIDDVSGDDLRLLVYILEDGLIYEQSGGTSDYEHNNVLRDAISGTFGDAGIITANTSGTQFSNHYTYTTDDSWVVDNLYIIAFVANYDDLDVNNREILNAEEVKLTNLIPLSVNEVNSNISVYPSPAKDIINVRNASNSVITLIDISGSTVINQEIGSDIETINVSDLSSGLYILRFVNENKVTERKINIVK